MSKSGIISLSLIIIIIVTFVFYFDIFNLQYSQESEIATILYYEDSRRVSDKLVQKINSPDPEIRKKAALAIGRIGDLSKTDIVFKMLNDSVPEVAETAALAIGLTGDKRYAQRLIDLSHDFPVELQAACIQSAGYLADSTMSDVIADLGIALSHLDHRVREQAIYALWRANGKSAVEKMAELLRDDPVRPVQIAALYTLGRMEIENYYDLYQNFLPDYDPYVRSLAMAALTSQKNDDFTQLIARGLNDRDNNVVSQAIASLTSIGTPRAIDYLVSSLDYISDEKLKMQLLQSFTALKSDKIKDYVHDEINNNRNNFNIVVAGINYLAEIEGEDIMPLIDTLSEIDNSYLKSGIAYSLQIIGGENVKPRLNALFGDSAVTVRVMAFNALCVVDSGNIDYFINKALSDENFVVTSVAVDKIGEKNKTDMLGQLMTLINMGGQIETDVKRSVVAAVGAILARQADSLAEEILFRAVMDKDHLVSKEAAQVYQDVLGIDKSAYINLPKPNFSKRKLQGHLENYKKNPRAIVRTNKGDFEIDLHFDVAPLTVANFIKLANQGFYNGLIFHRVIPNFVVQGGDPDGHGWGGAGYNIRCEYGNIPYERGSVGIATSGKDSGSSQFFITVSPQPHLDGRYTLFGKVNQGLESVGNICRGDTIYTVQIISEGK